MLEALILWRLGSLRREVRDRAVEELEKGEYDGEIAVLFLPVALASAVLWPVTLALLLEVVVSRGTALALSALAAVAVAVAGSPPVWGVVGVLVTATLVGVLDSDTEIL